MNIYRVNDCNTVCDSSISHATKRRHDVVSHKHKFSRKASTSESNYGVQPHTTHVCTLVNPGTSTAEKAHCFTAPSETNGNKVDPGQDKIEHITCHSSKSPGWGTASHQYPGHINQPIVSPEAVTPSTIDSQTGSSALERTSSGTTIISQAALPVCKRQNVNDSQSSFTPSLDENVIV